MEDKYNLNRFLEAQNSSYDIAFHEIKNGLKKSHWMWYIFPQFNGLGYSEISRKYAIKSLEEAQALMDHPILGKRLINISIELLKHSNKTAYEIFGWPDDLKLKSCMSLFTMVQSETDIFQKILDQYFEGKTCNKTISIS